jgi:NAD(P)-dependent dehydrogenase (short-subunit alcohol dehydrogenase family)
MQLDMSRKAVIVPGVCRGIGRGIAARFLGEGADVVICARHPPDEPVVGGGRTASFVAADVRETGQVDAVVAHTLDRFGKIDVLVNNAVIVGKRQPFLSSDASWLDTSYRVNTRAPYVLMQKAGAHMVGRGGGSIINITTGGLGQPPAPTGPVSEKEMDSIDPCYPISKAPLDRMTTALASELWASNIGITAITPGLVITERIRAAALRPWVDMNAGQPAEITAAACAFLIQNPFKYTGRKIPARDILEEEGLLEDLLAGVQTA